MKDLLGRPSHEESCMVTCAMKDLCAVAGCRKAYAASRVKDIGTGHFLARAAPALNLALKKGGMAAVMHCIPSRRRQRRAAKAAVRKGQPCD